MARKQLYVSLDIEADGPYPIEYSMRNFGMEVFDEEGLTYGTFERNLKPLPEAKEDPDTMKNFWDKNPEAWAYVNTKPQDAQQAMQENKAWLKGIANNHSAVLSYAGFPLCYDFMWHYIYLVKFTGDFTPMSFSGFDIKTAAKMVLDVPYTWATKRNFPRRWFTGSPPHDHTGLSDAIGQRVLAVNILKEGKEKLNGR